MLAQTIRQCKPALLMFFWLSLATGAAYPLAVTGLAGALFPDQARGSLVAGKDGTAGSRLIGQPTASDRYFWGRPSATAPYPYNAAASSGSNLGPSNPALAETVTQRVAALKAAHGDGPVPMDLVTASGSGLDPHIGPRAAMYQVDRVARARGLSRDDVAALVQRCVRPPLLGFWGGARVNVARLNMALDTLAPVR